MLIKVIIYISYVGQMHGHTGMRSVLLPLCLYPTLAVKGAEGDAERLHSRQDCRVVIHDEHIIAGLPKLHDHLPCEWIHP